MKSRYQTKFSIVAFVDPMGILALNTVDLHPYVFYLSLKTVKLIKWKVNETDRVLEKKSNECKKKMKLMIEDRHWSSDTVPKENGHKTLLKQIFKYGFSLK